MINRILIGIALISTAFGISNAVSAQQEVEGQCRLQYEDSITRANNNSFDYPGSCTLLIEEPIITIKGTVEENGQEYTAIIDNSQNTGLILGAGTFLLADGELTENETNRVSWPNGYTILFEAE